MAEIYVVLPLTAKVVEELVALGISHPEPLAHTQSPSPRQVLTVVADLPEMRVTVSRLPDKQWIRIDLTPARYGRQRPAGSGTEVNLSGVTDDETPCEIAFRGGTTELVAFLTRRIAAACGPQVIFPASGADPLVCVGEQIP